MGGEENNYVRGLFELGKGEEGNGVGRARERKLKEKQGNEREGIYERGKS